jgi:hypothetical protein
MLKAGQSHNVKFKVNVMGTSSEPRVRVILGTTPELSFHATKEGDDWASNLEIPGHIAPGSYDMRVEVHLNNRLFTPINRKIDVQGIELAEPLKAASVPTEPESPLPMDAKPAEQPVQVKPVVNDDAVKTRDLFHSIAMNDQGTSVTLGTKPKVKAPEMPKVIAKLPKIEPKATLAPKVAEPIVLPPAPELSLLSRASKAPAVPMKKRFESKKVPSQTPIRVKISEIDAVTTQTVAHIVESCKPIKAVRKTPRAGSPVKLVKEQLFYE